MAPRVAVMPARHPRLAHLMPYWRGDSLRALVIAIVARLWGIDQNVQVDANGVPWIVHWGNAAKNKLGWIVAVNAHGQWLHDSKGREIRVRDPRRGVPISRRHTADVNRLRSARFGGRRLYTVFQHIAYLAKLQHHYGRRLVLALEAKGIPSVPTFRKIHDSAAEHDVSAVVMRLQNIPGWRDCLAHAHLAGLQTALLPRGPKPSDWDDVDSYTDAVWGNWRKR